VEKDMAFGVLVYRRPNSPPPEKRISLTESTFGKLKGVEDTIKHQRAKEEIEHPSINNP